MEKQTIRLLVIDDDEVDRLVVRRAAAKSALHLEVVEASDLESGAAELRRGGIDCALVDLRLPDGEGLELLKIAPSVPMLVLTGASGRAEEALSAGAQDYIVKDDINPTMLARTIRYAIERKQSERMRAQLAHADRLASLGRLAASVAHEINNPAAFISANLTTLDRHLEALSGAARAWAEWETMSDELRARVATIEPGELASLIQESQTGITRIREIVRQLRNFARGSDEEEEVAEVRLNEVVEWASALTRNEVQHRAEFVVEAHAEVPTFMGRAGKIAQVATNLILNAAQAIPEGDVAGNIVRVEARVSPAGEAMLTVEDSGVGMDARVKRRALEPFFTTKGPGEGTGLGLPIAMEIVRTHGGTMVFEDRPGRGTRVVVKIPPETGLAAPAPLESALPPAIDADRQLSILLIDDEAPIRRAYRRLLRPHRVEATTADEGLALLRQGEQYDVILCDLMMPGKDGIDVFQELGIIAPGLQERVVFCTGGAFGERARSFLDGVPNLVLEKPVSRDAILAAALNIRAA